MSLATLKIKYYHDEERAAKIEHELDKLGHNFETLSREIRILFKESKDAYAVAGIIKKKFTDQVTCVISF